MRARSILAASLPLLLAPVAGAQCEDKLNLVSPEGKANDRFGDSVAIDGATLVVGKTRSLLGAHDDDAVYVYDYGASGWAFSQKLVPALTAGNEDFGDAVDIEGDTILVGDSRSNNADSTVADVGAAYIFERTSSGWVETARLDPIGGTNGSAFGIHVDLDADGTQAIVGAFFENGVGRAYIFQKSGANWNQTAQLSAPSPSAGDNFGVSVAIDGDTAVVGDWLDDDKGLESGSAYVYTRNFAGQWSQLQKLTANDGAAGDNFGIDVDIDGDRILVGACGDDALRGSAYVFDRSVTFFAESDKVVPSDGVAGDLYGVAVGLSGERGVLGAFGVGADIGAAYLVEQGVGGWNEVGKLTASDGVAGAAFGNSVSIDGNQVVAGAPGDTGSPPAVGKVYVYTAYDEMSLHASPNKVSVGSGGTQTLRIETCPVQPGTVGSSTFFYFIVGSATGTSPGFPIDGFLLPLTFDSYSQFSLLNGNQPPYSNTFGVFDGNGEASAAITIPPGSPPNFVNFTLHHAALMLELQPALVLVRGVSDASTLQFLP